MGRNYCYARVSSQHQKLDRQIDALMPYVDYDEEGKPYLYQDKASGKDMERVAFKEMLRAMRKGDTLYVKSIDRIGRNKQQIKDCLEKLQKLGVRVKVIDMPTTMQEIPKGNEWIVEMINNIMIEVYTSIAQQERETILQRQSEGIAAAKKKGKHLGRPVLELPKEWDKLYKQWRDGELKAVEFMDKVKMKKATFYKKVKEYEADHK